MSKKLIGIIALIVVLAAGAAVYFFVLRDSGDKEDKPVELYNYAVDDAFVTNVKDSSKLFKTTIVLVVNQDGMDEFFETKQYVIRDTILFILRDLTEADIQSDGIQDELRAEIPGALNDALQIDNIVSVYFSDFVMQ